MFALTSSPTASTSRRPKIILRAKTGWQPVDIRELWEFRELLLILALRDIKVRYKQTVLGVAWAIIQPFFTMVVFTILFAGLGRLPTDGVRPEVFYYCGMLPWQLFATSMASAGISLLNSQNLITKTYFPRLFIPMASVVTGLIDFAIAFTVLLALMLWFRVAFHPQIVFLPVFVALGFFAAMAVGLWLSALSVEYRDVRYVIPFLTQFWMFATPIIYPSSIVKSEWKKMLLGLNPMSGVVEGFRWCMIGTPMSSREVVVSAVTIFLTLIGGAFYFRRMEKTFADLV